MTRVTKRFGGAAFPLGAGGGGAVLILAPDAKAPQRIREALPEAHLEIPVKIRASGHKFENIKTGGQSMNVLMLASEAAPFLRTGGPADVVSDLTLQLRRQNPPHDARLIIPYYRNLNLTEPERAGLRCVVSSLRIPLGAYERRADIWRLNRSHEGYTPLPVYLVKDEFYFGRENAYGYLDDYERFSFFTRAVLEMLRASEFASEVWKPEIIHGHDWIAGLIPFWLRHTYREDASLAGTAFVYTLHNAGFPGQFGRRALAVAELEQPGIYGKLGETAGRINFMARGVLAADAVNTVSPTHAQEVMRQTAVPGLRGALEMSGASLVGIPNGLDFTRYDPALDDKIASQFNANSLHRRARNKRQLQEHEKCRLEVRSDAPLLGMVCRLISDKGVGLLREVLEQLVTEDGVQLVLLATPGDYEFREAFEAAAAAHPGQVAVVFGYDEEVACLIYAGSDIVLVPSRREPCGLSQMIAMRYGAVPVVRKTGGLADTVQPWDGAANLGKGFLFEPFESSAFLQAVRQALQFYRTRQAEWRQLQEYNLGVDFSWRQPVAEYERLYSLAGQRAVTRGALPAGEVIVAPRDAMLVEAVLMANQQATFTASEGANDVDRLKDYLKQVARIVRELLRSDAVLLWTSDSSTRHTLRIGEASFARDNQTAPPEAELQACRFRSAEAARTWSQDYIYRRDTGGDSLRGQSGFLNSAVATEQGWNVQLSVPVIAQGATLGQIDVFYRDASRALDEWERGAVEAIANTVAVNFERTHLAQRSSRLLTAHRKMSEVEPVEDVAKILLREARLLTHAEDACLDLEGGPSYGLDSVNRLTAIPFPRDRTEAPGQIIRADLREDEAPSVGVIAVRKAPPRGFSREDETTLACLARQAAGLVRIAQHRQQRDKARVGQLETLVASLVAGGDFDKSLELVVDTAAAVLGAEAASLYLINESTQEVVIRAAAGYQKPLMANGAVYQLGEGVTGWIAQKGERVRADTSSQLRLHPAWRGKHDAGWGGREPQSFLGVPLKVVDPTNPVRRVIGVLKVEDVKKSEKHPETHFTNQDELLVTMMANVIATVVYNAQLSQTLLRQLSDNLGRLSMALAGGSAMEALFEHVVQTMAEIMGAQASSLYLIEPGTDELVIRAATGYQKPLVARRAMYKVGEGITGWVAARGELVRADNLVQLQAHPAWKGKQNPGQGGREPRSYLALPLKVVDRTTGAQRVTGVLKVEDIERSEQHPQSHFTDQDVLLVGMMANIIATVVYNAQTSNTQFQQLSANLDRMSRALAGGREMRELVAQVVETIARVIGADASSLYLIDEATNEVVIQAAVGYQKPLVERRAKYRMGEGITGWIAETGRSFRANSLEELKKHSAWKGKQNPGQGDREPQAFLGLPLRVVDRVTGKEKVIGVLKVEDIVHTSGHPEPYFTDQDELLVTMMANVIAAVVYNTQASDTRVHQLSANLESLSRALAGGRELRELMAQVVETIARVIGADASSLYLIDEATNELVIQAAVGYQKPLVERRATYRLGEGITGWIAETGGSFRANSLEELKKHSAWKGKQNPGQGDREPQAFLGLPLRVVDRVTGKGKVIGVLKVEDIVRTSGHPEPYFTDQDELLVTMMANIIATVIQNTRHGEARLGGFLAEMGLLSEPISAVPALLRRCACSEDPGVIDQLALTLARRLDQHPGDANKELAALFEAKANIELYRRVSNWATQSQVRWESALYHAVLGEQRSFDRWEHAQQLAAPLLRLRDSATEPVAFQEAAQALVAALAKTAGLKLERPIADTWGDWAGAVLNTGVLFGEDVALLPVAFRRGAIAESEEGLGLSNFVANALQGISAVFVLVDWQNALSGKLVEAARQEAGLLATEMVLVPLPEIVSLLSSREAGRRLRRLVLRQTRAVSPFVTDGAVHGPMFFGRDPQLNEILRRLQAGASCVMVGGRRVGKSSILRRLHELWLPNRPFRSVYFDCSELSFQAGEMVKAFEAAAVVDWSPEPPPSAPATFGDLLKACSPQSKAEKKLVLLLDEADKLVPQAGSLDWKFFDQLHALIASRRASVVLAGEHKLWMALHNADHATFNLGVSPIALGPLTCEEVQMLVERTIADAEIQLADHSVARTIFELTGGHPNVVQRLCHRLFLQISHAEVRRLTVQDIDAVVAVPEFQKNDYLDTYWARASTLEKYLSLLFIDCPHLRQLEDVRTELKRRLVGYTPDPQAVLDALEALVNLRLILKKSQEGGYEFAFPGFPKVVRGTISLREQLAVLEHEMVSGNQPVKEIRS